MALRVPADEQGQLDALKLGQEEIEPELGAFSARRQIATRATARITVTHWNDGDMRFIVEGVFVYAHPRPQPLSACVVPGNPAGVHTRAGRLSDHENAGGRSSLQDRARAKRKMPFARTATAHRGEQ